MKLYNKITKFAAPVIAVLAMSGCTKLDESLGSTLTNSQVSNALGSAGTGLLLSAAYADLGGPLTSQDQVFSLMENTTDESLVPTRGGDWDDNGVWRVLHNHTWNADHGQILSVFNSLNKINFDATNVLGFNPSKGQAAEARFIRALALYYLLDLYGQYPIRNPGDNLLLAPEVKSGAAGGDFIISELTAILPDLPTGNGSDKANPDAARTLLMKCYLQRGTWANRAAPTFAAADMAQVIALGNTIMSSGKYSYAANYFDNFNPKNDNSPEAIFRYNNTAGVGANNSGIGARWNMTLHYNSYTPNNPNAGWNGFSTIGSFYSAFNTSVVPTAYGPADTVLDGRLGGRNYQNSKTISGINPGFLVNQQYNENGVPEKDRKGNPLAFVKDIASNMIETGSNLEVTGIRVVKYVPDYTQYGGGPAGNDLMIFRYPDVVLMVAEAKQRTGDAAGALTLVNALRAARNAAPLVTMALVNTSNVEDPNTLLAERGRELYWESVRRTDLQRFGVYLKPWEYKPNDDPKNLLFPVPNQALAANPNLKQNPGY
ncbi:MAG: RagB/SusD family nutrient uptake outer membrane protein [Bacteroidota bacterium]|nr:RagB/SusD family nutrient uptake outer membrane protein [Bacteroidota bacterium]